jgi:hypothetical protein
MASPDSATLPTVTFAGKLLGPAGEVQVGALEFRLPEATLGAVEDIDAGGR